MLAGLPARFTAADRVQQVPAEASGAFIASLQADAKARASFFETGHPEVDLDMTDGLRVAFAGGQIVHLRPSGNAPECRCYAEAATRQEAEYLVRHHLQKLRAVLTEGGNT